MEDEYRILTQDAAEYMVGRVTSPGSDHVCGINVFHVYGIFNVSKMGLHLRVPVVRIFIHPSSIIK